MNFSVMTLMTSLFLGSIVFCAQCLLLKSTNKRSFINSKLLTVVYFLFILKIILPFEFGYTTTLKSERVLPAIRKFMNIEVFVSNQYQITILNLLLIIWIIGSAYKLYHFFKSYQELKKLMVLATDKGKVTKANFGKEYPVKIMEQLDSPAVLGWRNPIILLPNIQFTEKELKYIFTHELIHIANFDIIAKYLYEIILSIYWWNPLMYLFRNQMNQIIELRTDDFVVSKLSENEKADYIKTLVRVRKYQLSRQKFSNYAISFSCGNEKLLLQRSTNILKNKKEKTNYFSLITITIVSFYLITSITFEPYSIKTEDVDDTFKISKDSSFLIQVEEDLFDLYIQDEYIATINKSQFDENIKTLNIINNIGK